MRAIILAVALFCVTGSALAEPLEVPAGCRQSPTAECLVDAVAKAAVWDDQGALRDAARQFVMSGQFAQSERLRAAMRTIWPAPGPHGDPNAATSIQMAVQGGVEIGNAGFDAIAEQSFQHALSLVPDCKLASDYSDRSQKENAKTIAKFYANIACAEARWGQLDKAKATLARMRNDCAFGVPAEDLADSTASRLAWTDPDAALAAGAVVPEPRHDAMVLVWLKNCALEYGAKNTILRVCSRWLGLLKGAGNRTTSILDMPTDGTDAALRDKLAAAEKVYLEGPGGRSFMMGGGINDPLVRMARDWLSLGQPGEAIRILDERQKRPDIFPIPLRRPMDDYAAYAEALVRLGRTGEALTQAETARADFAARPLNEFEKFRSMMHSAVRSMAGHEPDPAVDGNKPNPDGDKAYEAVLRTLTEEGKADEIRANETRLSAAFDPQRLDGAIADAELKTADAQTVAKTMARGQKLPYGDPFVGFMSARVNSLMRAGKDAEAQAAASALADNNGDLSGYIAVAGRQKARGDSAAALATLQQTVGRADPLRNAGNLESIAGMQAQTGDFPAAWATLGKLPPNTPSEATAIVELEAKAGHRADAVAHAMTAVPDRGRTRALLAIAVAIAQS